MEKKMECVGIIGTIGLYRVYILPQVRQNHQFMSGT